ncbi:MAG: DUF1449 domain-containing protein [Gammaproteobacteria bacterium]|nr:DUF1449 domain-containing protein [Gammaproteobacteria bacterium]
MFAILLSEGMDPFYENISSFPTLIYTVLLVVCIFYWAGAVLGFVDLDVIDLDLDSFDTSGGDVGSDSPHSTPDVLAGLMLRFGLVGVPVTISVSILALIGWLLCYYTVHFVFPFVPGSFLKFAAGIPVLVGTLYVSAMITGVLIRPLRPLFQKATQETIKQVLGQTAVVRTSRVDNEFGEATLEDGGAGLILKVRTTGENRFAKGDKVVIYEKLSEQNIYRVISEEEFLGL